MNRRDFIAAGIALAADPSGGFAQSVIFPGPGFSVGGGGGGAGGTVAFDAKSGANAPGAGVTGLTWTHTPSGIPSGVFLAIGLPASTVTPSVTYGGTSMGTAVKSQSTSNGGTVKIFALANPSSGAQAVAVTFSSSSSGAAEVISVTGSNTTTASDFSTSNVDNTNTATGITATVTTTANDLVFAAATNENTSGMTWTTGLSQTRVAVQQFGSNVEQLVTSYAPASGATVTVSETTGAADRYAICAVSIKHA